MSTSLKYWEAVRAAKLEAERARGHAPPPPTTEAPADAPSVRLVDIDIPFPRMVAFMVKWTFATIPAAIIVVVIAIIASSPLGILLAFWRGGR
jgi:hypothetical protein